MGLAKTMWVGLPILFLALVATPAEAQETSLSTGTSSLAVNNSTVSSDNETRSASVAMDLFEAPAATSESEKLNELNSKDKLHPKDFWVPYPSRRELQAEVKNVVNHFSHQRRELAHIGLDRIESIQKKLGIVNIPILSMALARESRISRSKGDIDESLRLLDIAAKISPELFQLHLIRLQSSLTTQPMSIGTHAEILKDYVMSRVLTFRNQRGFAFEAFILFMMSIAAAIVVFIVVQTLKYMRYIVYSFARLLPSAFSQVHVAMLGVLVLCTPVAFGIGWFLSFGLLVATLWSFQKKGERYVGFFSWLFLLLVPVFLIITSAFISSEKSIDQDILTVLNDADSHHAHKRLAVYSKTSNGSRELNVLTALAFSNWYDREYQQSLKAYSEALRIEPNNAILLNNKGKLLYFTGDKKEAKKHFQLAMGSGEYAQPVLNYASLILDEGKFEAAQAALTRARRIDPRITKSYGDISAGVSTGEKLLFIRPNDRFAWKNLGINGLTRAWEDAVSLFRQSGNPLHPVLVLTLLFVLGLVGLMLARNREVLGMFIPCTKCARPTRWVREASHCDQCQSVFLRSDNIDPEKRKRKKQKVEKYQNRIAWFEKAVSLLPGLSDISTDRAVRGFLRLSLFCFLLSAFFGSAQIRAGAFGLATHVPYLFEVGFGMLTALMIVLSMRRAFRG